MANELTVYRRILNQLLNVVNQELAVSTFEELSDKVQEIIERKQKVSVALRAQLAKNTKLETSVVKVLARNKELANGVGRRER